MKPFKTCKPQWGSLRSKNNLSDESRSGFSRIPMVILKRGVRRYYCHLLWEFHHVARRGTVTDHIILDYASKIDEFAMCRIMNRTQCAQFLGVSLRTLDRLVHEQGLPSECRRLQEGKRPQRIFLVEDVLEWNHRHLANLRSGKKGD